MTDITYSIPHEVAGKVALVTGAASGIGLACVELLLQAGARVAFCGRDPGRLEAAQHPVDLLVIARMVSPRGLVEFTTASSEMWQYKMEIVHRCPIGKSLRVVAIG